MDAETDAETVRGAGGGDGARNGTEDGHGARSGAGDGDGAGSGAGDGHGVGSGAGDGHGARSGTGDGDGAGNSAGNGDRVRDEGRVASGGGERLLTDGGEDAREGRDIEAMTRFPVPDEADLPDDLRERIDEETARAGFTPNVFRALAYRPSHFRAFFAYHDALVEQTELTRAEIEMIVVAVSGVNDCLYCNVAHGALVRIYAEDPLLAEQLLSNHRTADVSDRHRAMLDFAVKLTEAPAEVDDEDFARLEGHGFSRRAIWDVGSVSAFYNMSNRLVHLADMRPNEEFYTLGRD